MRANECRIIDVHRHCLPKPSTTAKGVARVILEKRIGWRETPDYAVSTCRGVSSIIYPELTDIDAQVRGQDEAGIVMGILSFSMALETMVSALPVAAEKTLTRMLNDATATMVNRFPDKLAFIAILNPFSKYAIQECERCLDHLGAKGVNISTSWKGRFLDSPRLDTFWQFVENREVPFSSIHRRFLSDTNT
ncbi:MAG TPA: amidohydrolase family protein [Thermodesulfobacteriota bacterium]|nr:amidohydrolase family protein [Thermodesulfobacteriota bacterium]